MKSFRNHINPEKEEQLNRVKIEVENKVKKILKLAKGINVTKEGNLKKKSEIINLLEDFHQHYEALYFMYDDLRGVVKKKTKKDGSSSSSSTSSPSDSDAYYSPVESTPKRPIDMSRGTPGTPYVVEDTTILNNKLSVVRDRGDLSQSQELNEKTSQAEMEEEVDQLKLETEKEGEMRDKKSGLERQVLEVGSQVNVEMEELENKVCKLQGKISQLEASISEGVKEASAKEKMYKALENELIEKVKNLENKVGILQNERNSLETELEDVKNERKRYLKEAEEEKEDLLLAKSRLERKNTELTNKIADQQKTLLELGDDINKMKLENEKSRFLDSKPNLQLMERKIDDMGDELRKQFEDKCRILSRRIRVAEQLHVENKEWCRKMKEEHEKEKKEMQENMGNIKDISVVASEMLIGVESMILKMEECHANFLNRISKASCDLIFAKEWARRKNTALVHVKQDVDGLLIQLDEKEGEILLYREKVWRWENKMREMEKLMKKKEDGMVGLQEEKREAIRQLCVWIDYHRSRCDYYMKMLFDMNARRKKP